MNQSTLIGLRRMKEYARRFGGAETVITDDKETIEAMQSAHKKFTKKKEEEEKLRKMEEVHF